MNSRVSVDAESEEVKDVVVVGGGAAGRGREGEDTEEDYAVSPSLTQAGGNVVLVLPPDETAHDGIPLMVNGVPVYISQSSTGSPVYIRQYPPTVEDIMTPSPKDVVDNFDGFSDASAQTFEGFSEASSNSVLFEGFCDDAINTSKLSILQSYTISNENFEDIVTSDESENGQIDTKPPPKSPKKQKRRNVKSEDFTRRSRSPVKPLKKRVKQEVTELDTHTASQTPTATQPLGRRRQSTERHDKKPPEIPEAQAKKPRNLPLPDDPDYIGERCNNVGCTISFLERMAVKKVTVTNGVIQELNEFANKISWDREFVVRWIQRLSGVRRDGPVEMGDLRSVTAVLKRRKALATYHSGNPFIKAKMKAYDDVEFVLPSVTQKRGGAGVKLETVGGALSTDDESSSMTSDSMDVKPDRSAKVGKEEVTVPEGGKGQPAAQQEKGRSGRGVKRPTHVREKEADENKRNVKERRISTEISQSQDGIVCKAGVIKKEAAENKINAGRKVLGKTERSRIDTMRRISAIISEMEGEHTGKEMQEKEMTEEEELEVQESQTAEGDKGQESAGETNRYSVGKVATRRASMILTEEEEEKLHIADEKTKQDAERPKKDRQRSRRSSAVPADSSGTKQTSDKKKSLDHDVEEDERKETEGEREEETADQTKTTVSKDEKKSESEEQQSVSTGGELPLDGKQQQQTETQSQATSEVKMERRISTRRASMLAQQEKEKHTEVGVTKQETSETQTGTERRTSRRLSIMSGKQEGKEQVTDKQGKQATIKTERERRMSIRRGSQMIQQEDKGKQEPVSGKGSRRTSEKDEGTTEKQYRHNDVKKGLQITEKEEETGTDAKKNRRFTSRRQSAVTDKDEAVEISKVKGRLKEEETRNREGRDKESFINNRENKLGKEDARADGEVRPENDEPVSPSKETEDHDDKENQTDSPCKEEIAGEENKRTTSGGQDKDQIILKRNKVINRDKRISRWQSRKMNRSGVEVTPVGKLSGTPQPERLIDEGVGSLASDGMQDVSNCSAPRKNRLSLDSVVTGDKGRCRGRRRRTLETDKHLPAKATCDPRAQDPSAKEPPPGASAPVGAETTPRPPGTESSYDGTLGVSKSGRLRKPSAKGIQSIEIKCLFMQRNGETPRAPPPLPDLKNEGDDKDWRKEKRSPGKTDRKEKESELAKMPRLRRVLAKMPHLRREPGGSKCFPVKLENTPGKSRLKSPVHRESPFTKKSPQECKEKKLACKYRKQNEFASFTHEDGHLIPKFYDTDYYLGDYCARAGVTVHDLNSNAMKKVKMTFGMIKELHDFYMSHHATKTSLAVRLFKMNGRKILDNTHLLSTVIRVTSISAIKHSEKERLDRAFSLPVRIKFPGPVNGPEKAAETPEQPEPEDTTPPVPTTDRKLPRKRGAKPEDSGDECCDYGDVAGPQSAGGGEEEEEEHYGEILLTRGEKGSITRGDVVHLYMQWLKNKMSLGSNTFVTDLLRSVEQLMAERGVASIRIPAGTLMSSSVRLHDEYKQILRLSKEDAIMYLQEDWLEDIKYLLSISAPSRRSTTEGEAPPAPPPAGPPQAATAEHDDTTAEKEARFRPLRHRSGSGGGGRVEEIGKLQGESVSNSRPFKRKAKADISRSHQMESVGKRQAKRRNIRKSLQQYDRDILQELEKAGVLEEEDEDMLLRLAREEGESEYEDGDEEVDEEEEKRERQEKKNKDAHLRNAGIRKSLKAVEDESEFEAEKIVDYQEIHDRKEKRLRYLVRWVGRGPEDDGWVDESDLYPSVVDAFWKRRRRPERDDRASRIDAKPTSPAKVAKDGENIIQAMVKHHSDQHAATDAESPVVTKRELLCLYDSWRQENQDELIAGGSNTVNVEVLKNRVGDLMASRNVEFYPESLLNACFMMTLMKVKLQSKMAIDRFLDTSCLEVLESSHRQYLKRKYSDVDEIPPRRRMKDQKHSISSLQEELHSLQLDLTTVQKWRTIKSSQLRAVEEEVDYLETATSLRNIKKSKKAYLKQELQKLNADIKELEKHRGRDSDHRNAGLDLPLFAGVAEDPEDYERSVQLVRDKLVRMNMSQSTVSSILDIVARKVAGECFRE